MKRRLAFRAWIPDAKQLRSEAGSGMFYQEDQYLYSFIRRIHDQFEITHPSYLPFDLEERLTQCTGLKDKNGKEIYEGDVVRLIETVSILPLLCGEFENLNCVGKIEWDCEGADYNIAGNNEDDLRGLGAENQEIEILGNIYENPKLLPQLTNPNNEERVYKQQTLI